MKKRGKPPVRQVAHDPTPAPPAPDSRDAIYGKQLLTVSAFVPARHKPRYLAPGSMGTLDEAIPGDLVVVEASGVTVLGSIGWRYNNGALALSIALHEPWVICTKACCLITLPATTPARFFALRPGRDH